MSFRRKRDEWDEFLKRHGPELRRAVFRTRSPATAIDFCGLYYTDATKTLAIIRRASIPI